MTPSDTEKRIDALNRKLSELTRRDAPELNTGAAAALADPLWIWGVLGGKNVGKTTLINALAASELARTTGVAGEGTLRPAAYMTQQDVGPLKARFAQLQDVDIELVPEAPAGMRHLVLIDLPDFDSLFRNHVEQVRQVSRLLDGVIWVTTPKKVADLQGIQEVERVLKDRVNFVFVVNKVDWVLDQAIQPVEQDLKRIRDALREQIAACGHHDGDESSFLISARYPSASAILQTIARTRNLPDTKLIADAKLKDAARRIESDFSRLKQTLLTPPSAEAIKAHKRANLTYQSQQQANTLLAHYRPQVVLERFDATVNVDQVQELVERCFPDVYCETVLNRNNDSARLLTEWSRNLFQQRLSKWPLLGIVAWPATAIGQLLSALRRDPADPAKPNNLFQFDGVSLEHRAKGVTAGLRANIARVDANLKIEPPDSARVALHFRQEVAAVTEQLRVGALQPFIRPSGVLGRLFRSVLVYAVLLWFLLAQPILAALLAGTDASLKDMLVVLVQTLSAAHVLWGLLVCLLLLSLIVAAIHASATRDAYRAVDRLANEVTEQLPPELRSSTVTMLMEPLDDFREELQRCTDALQAFASSSAP